MFLPFGRRVCSAGWVQVFLPFGRHACSAEGTLKRAFLPFGRHVSAVLSGYRCSLHLAGMCAVLSGCRNSYHLAGMCAGARERVFLSFARPACSAEGYTQAVLTMWKACILGQCQKTAIVAPD